MAEAFGEYYFYPGFKAKKKEIPNVDSVEQRSGQVRPGNEQKQEQSGKKANEMISVFGIKISYAKAFGIAFLIIFLLLFFPGIGVSSSTVSSKNKPTGDTKGDPKETSKT